MFVFFDIGDTLVDETRYAQAIQQSLHRLMAKYGLGYTIDQFLTHWDTSVAQKGWRGLFAILADIAELSGHSLFWAMDIFQEYTLHVAPRASDLFEPFPDAQTTLEILSQTAKANRKLRFGILANQPPWIRQRMKDWQLLSFFAAQAVIISDEIGISKPQPEIFQFALYRADVPPQEAVMIGNDYQNDMLPAKALGWHTVWLRRPNPYRRAQPPEPDDLSAADVQIHQLSEVPAVLEALLHRRSERQ
jgi:HAD superfamily hydrolase (TIGR01549 family)